MKAVKVFVSFDVDNDEVEKQLFEGVIFNSSLSLVVAGWSARSSMKPERWDTIVSNKIEQCQVLVVLAGRQAARASNISKEIAMARELAVPVFGIYVNGAGRGTNLPTGLAISRTLLWDWGRIDQAIKLGLREGRNKPGALRYFKNRS